MEHSTVQKRPLSSDLDEIIFGPTLSRIDKSSESHDIHVDKPEFKIGRSRDNDEIILDTLISRRHCILTCEEDEEWAITDCSSSVTFVNNVPLTPGVSKILHNGDIVQLSTSEKHTYLFALRENQCKPKKPKMNNELLMSDVFMRQKTFAENQECQKKAFTDKLQTKQKEQDELKQQLEMLLKEQDVTKNCAEEYKNKIAVLENRIQQGNVLMQHLNTLFAELSEKLENERLEFEKKLDVEKQKWQQALHVTKLEKEMLELKMTSLMENKVKEEKDKAQLLNEKIVLEKRLQETEKALKEKEAVQETIENNIAGPSYADPNDSCILLEVVDNAPQYRIIDEIDLTDVSQLITVDDQQENIVNKISNIMDDQLTCSICSELFVKATTLACMHTYCQYCIKCWMKKKKICAVCRAPITSMTRSIVIDNFIDSMLENLPIQFKERRKEILKERKEMEGRKKTVSKKAK
ncbi:E3 ubiquitin-protein ligase rnf8-like [Ceratina calcarata]|uniref:E3 ubiquitin-protein ligase CHFR n=1 Tax=Ceratina calcarata TaxID=156304 RepID=A0AAJ7IVX9_9HYME|nr:E3 ubiquitin-protein ligase rnf8-like [Ceratina calcarata]